MVRMPRCLRRPSSVMLKSGASMPTNTSGRSSPKRRVRSLRIFNRRGKRSSTSTTPMTASSSISYQASHPSACISGPATPTKRASGICALSARIKPAPRMSPEVSPATNPIVNGRFDITQRMMPRVERVKKSRYSCTTGCSLAVASISAFASSSVFSLRYRIL